MIDNLHTKVYVADGKHAIITSANLTNAGLLTNIEMGAVYPLQLATYGLPAFLSVPDRVSLGGRYLLLVWKAALNTGNATLLSTEMDHGR